MKVNLHGQLRTLYGDSFDVSADRVEDAIRALSLQLPNWPTDLVIDVPGFESVEKLSANTDAREIDLVPAIMGGGGKFGSIIMGVALIGITLLAPHIGLTIGAKLSGALLAAGIGMTLTGVMGLFMKAPSISRSNDPAASKYLGVNKNTTAIGTPIKLAWGRIPPAGHFLSLQSNSDNLAHAVWPTTPT